MSHIQNKHLLKLDRNNTNFQAKLQEYVKGLKNEPIPTEYSFLKYYQDIVREYMNNVEIDSRGLLVYHTMGMGKSILAVALAMDALKSGRQVIILLTKSLQENMRESIKKYVKMHGKVESSYFLAILPDHDLDAWIDRNFSFVSMNASNMLKQMNAAALSTDTTIDKFLESRLGEITKMASLDGKFIIVDEAQNLFRAITNGSKNAMGFYNMVMEGQPKLVFLSGTPISNDPFQLVPCFNMLGGAHTLPENYNDFNKYFVDNTYGRIKNKDKFQNRILGLVSYVTHTLVNAKNANGANSIEFPEDLGTHVVKVPMTPEQYVIYQLARDKEKEESGFGARFAQDLPNVTKPRGVGSSYRVKSRLAENFVAPEAWRGDPARLAEIPPADVSAPKFDAIYANIEKHPRELGLVYSQFVGMGGLGAFAKYLIAHGYKQYNEVPITTKESEEIEDAKDGAGSYHSKHSKHSVESVSGITDNPFIPQHSPEVSVTPIIEHSSVITSPEWLNSDGTLNLNNFISKQSHKSGKGEDKAKESREPTSRQFAIISGAVDTDTRKRIMDIFTSRENAHGEIIGLLLVSSTGAEGLDLKNIRHIHILEAYWDYSRINQVRSRGIRNDSHLDLDPKDRNCITYIYLAAPPATETDAEPTTDEELYQTALLGLAKITSFLEAIQEVSIECSLHSENCLVCSPTDQKLCTSDIPRDIAAANPCTRMKQETTAATKITVDNVEYFYRANPAALYDYDVFEFVKDLNAWREIKPTDLRLEGIIEAIKSKDAKK